MNVTRAALPVMRKQRSGLVLTISSTAGIAGGMFCTAYSREVRHRRVDGVAYTGNRAVRYSHDAGGARFLSTELLTADSTTYAKPSIDDYAERTKETVAAWNGMNGKQGGDPAKLADAIVQLAGLPEPPIRFAAGADALRTFETKANALLAQAAAYHNLSSSLAHDKA